ncbi:hypothetical protein K9U39_19535 [Rhodoblastus acidophilus]|nr:hypothetical protein [Rhodoblastus acidophilus]
MLQFLGDLRFTLAVLKEVPMADDPTLLIGCCAGIWSERCGVICPEPAEGRYQVDEVIELNGAEGKRGRS